MRLGSLVCPSHLQLREGALPALRISARDGGGRGSLGDSGQSSPSLTGLAEPTLALKIPNMAIRGHLVPAGPEEHLVAGKHFHKELKAHRPPPVPVPLPSPGLRECDSLPWVPTSVLSPLWKWSPGSGITPALVPVWFSSSCTGIAHTPAPDLS